MLWTFVWPTKRARLNSPSTVIKHKSPTEPLSNLLSKWSLMFPEITILYSLTFTIWHNKFGFFVHLRCSPFWIIYNLKPWSACYWIFLRLFLETLCPNIRSTGHKTRKKVMFDIDMYTMTYPMFTFSSSQWGILFCGTPMWFNLVLSKFCEVDKKRLLIGRTNPFSRYIFSLNGIHLFRSYFWETLMVPLRADISAYVLVDSPVRHITTPVTH